MIKEIWLLLDRRLRVIFWVMVLCIIISSLWNIGGIASLMPFMRAVAEPEKLKNIPVAVTLMDYLSITETTRLLLIAGSIVLFLFITGNLFLAFVIWVTIAFARRVSYYLATKLYSTYLSQKYPFFLDHNSSELLKNLFGETGNVAKNIVQPVMQILADGMLSIAIVIFLIIADPKIALIAAAVIGGGYGIIYLIFRSLLMHASRKK